ncbi:hypothetical protein FOXB_02678 [Fusarium oxysporum f. sp. conglutinans Fo5176]|uniref:Uncharacterized protein n=1 Tax=Fusarium oxysporum (strain Fo5176) TaxID=660025 RepID=F9F8F3_FUSOF|nr:hypothetical protein FOXB_02678 [Fusarium oxysporum f. sp. conglutinans Fo5176]
MAADNNHLHSLLKTIEAEISHLRADVYAQITSQPIRRSNDLLYTIAYGCQYSNSLIDMEKYSQANVNDMQKLDNPTESEIII